MKYAIVERKRYTITDEHASAKRIRNALSRETGNDYVILKLVSVTNHVEPITKSFATVSAKYKEIPSAIVKVGKEYPSGLVRCIYDKKVYTIHRKFLLFKESK